MQARSESSTLVARGEPDFCGQYTIYRVKEQNRSERRELVPEQNLENERQRLRESERVVGAGTGLPVLGFGGETLQTCPRRKLQRNCRKINTNKRKKDFLRFIENGKLMIA